MIFIDFVVNSAHFFPILQQKRERDAYTLMKGRCTYMKRKKRKHRKNLITSFFLFFAVFCITSILFYTIDYRITEIASNISRAQLKVSATEITNNSLTKVLDQMQVTSSDFLQQNENGTFCANTPLINQCCTLLSSTITKDLKALEKEKIAVSFGSMTGLSTLANVGPKLEFSLMPLGIVDVDYETDLDTAGINQIHFRIWVDISMEIRIIHPFYGNSFPMTRKIMLVDMVFSGQVPKQYIEIQP